jgi:hypothetical protein
MDHDHHFRFGIDQAIESYAGPVRHDHQLVVKMTSDFERTNPYVEELKRTAAYIAQPGKGILASDESNATTGKRYI